MENKKIEQAKTLWQVAEGCGKVSTIFLTAATIFVVVGAGLSWLCDKKVKQANK